MTNLQTSRSVSEARTVLAVRDLAYDVRRPFAPPLPLFHGVSFEIFRGERVALLGPNGSGKTTLLRLLLGLEKPHRGSCERSRELARAGLAYLPENPGLPPFLTVRRFLTWMAGFEGAGSRPALAERFGVEALMRRRIAALSKGELKRVALLALTAADAALFLLDEPLDGLDEEGIEAFAEWTAERAARGSAFLFSTHLYAALDGLADRTLRLAGARDRAPCGSTP